MFSPSVLSQCLSDSQGLSMLEQLALQCINDKHQLGLIYESHRVLPQPFHHQLHNATRMTSATAATGSSAAAAEGAKHDNVDLTEVMKQRDSIDVCR